MKSLRLPNFCSYPVIFSLLIYHETLALLFALSNGRIGFWSRLSYSCLTFAIITVFSAVALCFFRNSLNQSSLTKQCIWIFSIVSIVTFATIKLTTYIFISVANHYSVTLLFYLLTTNLSAVLLLRMLYYQQTIQIQVDENQSAKLMILRDRIKPHFLFNCLNCLNQLISSDRNRAIKAVDALSGLFRGAINLSPEHSLQVELDLTEKYLFLEGIRLEKRLSYKINSEESHQKYVLIELLIQPLVENAVKHGIEPLPSGGMITITTKMKNGFFVIEVSNTSGKAKSGKALSQPNPGNRHAVNNISERLKIAYGKSAKFKLDMLPKITIASIFIPLIHLK